MERQLFSKILSLPQRIRNRYGKRRDIPEYVPLALVPPKQKIAVPSAWAGLEEIIPDILDRFNVGRERCIEFGVEFGYSTVILSNYFDRVIGIDLFEGDLHTAHKEDHYLRTKESLADFPNIELHKCSYQSWIERDQDQYDFAHVDIVHTYKDTYRCGLWAVEHSTVTIFHDTESFLDVRNAVIDIAKKTGKSVYNYPHHYGLGIVVSV